MPTARQTVHRTHADAPERTRVRIDEAAVRLGLSPGAIRNRLARGSMHGEKRGRSWWVDLAAVASPASGRAHADGTRTHACARCTELAADNTWFKLRLEAAEVERAELRRLLAAQTPQRALAENAATAAETAENRPEAAGAGNHASAPFWAFWRR